MKSGLSLAFRQRFPLRFASESAPAGAVSGANGLAAAVFSHKNLPDPLTKQGQDGILSR